jgi:hypothetical protein
MTKKILTTVYAALWLFMGWVLYSDLFVWRKDDPSGAQLQAAQQVKRIQGVR